MERSFRSSQAEDPWLQAARAGDASELWKMCDNFRAALKGYVNKNLGQDLSAKLDPSDVVQQSMLEAYKSFDDFRGSTREEFQAWLVRIAQNETYQAKRFYKQQKRDHDREQSLLSKSDRKIDVPSTPESSGSLLFGGELTNYVVEVLDRLPEAECAVLRLRYVEGLKVKEIAEKVGRTPAAVAGLLKRGVKRARKIIDQDHGTPS